MLRGQKYISNYMRFRAIRLTGLKSFWLVIMTIIHIYFKNIFEKTYTVLEPQEKLKCGKYCFAEEFCSPLLVTSIG